MILRHIAVLTGLCLAPAALAATVPCAYRAQQPANLKAVLDHGFKNAGLFYLPEGYGGLGEGYGATSLFRGDAVVAQVRLSVDTEKDSQDLLVTDAQGLWLLKGKQRIHRCAAGICRDLDIKTRREVNGTDHPEDQNDRADQADEPAERPQDHSPFFLRWAMPGDYVQAYVYGRPVRMSVFAAMLGDSLKWVSSYLAATQIDKPVIVAEGLGQLNFAVVQDALLRPYFDLVNYTFTGGKNVAINGKVPSDEAYGRAIDLVRAHGLVPSVINLVIDERIERHDELPAVVSCDE